MAIPHFSQPVNLSTQAWSNITYFVTFCKVKQPPKKATFYVLNWKHQTITTWGAVARHQCKDFTLGSKSWSQVCVCSPWWNHWPPSEPAASRWCWSCRTGLCRSRWCSGPRWTPRWAEDTDSGRGPPGPAGGPPWWCAPNMGPLSGKGNTAFDRLFAKETWRRLAKRLQRQRVFSLDQFIVNVQKKQQALRIYCTAAGASHSGLDFFSKWQWQWRETGTVH